MMMLMSAMSSVLCCAREKSQVRVDGFRVMVVTIDPAEKTSTFRIRHWIWIWRGSPSCDLIRLLSDLAVTRDSQTAIPSALRRNNQTDGPFG
jgi:hypothetical protein